MNRYYFPWLLPLLLAGLAGCERHTDSRPGAPETASEALPKLGQVPNFSLTSQENLPFGSEQLQGGPYVTAFMFTRCPSICPRLTASMKRLDMTVQKAQMDLKLISISVDPDYDTPVALSEYAKKYGADPERWKFLTGDFKQIAATAEQGFKVALSGKIDEKRPHMGITHASHLILVDGRGQIRGYFRTSDDDVNDQILAALQKLAKE